MATAVADPLLDALVNDFGGNYVFALDLLEQYRQNRLSVEASWRDYFDRATGTTMPSTENGPSIGEGTPVEHAPTPGPGAAMPSSGDGADATPVRTATLVKSEPASPVLARSRALVVPAILPGDIAQPIRGGAMRIVENMEASLQVPTAT
jgi:2-oxoglutarate dehydrogenase E1 component